MLSCLGLVGSAGLDQFLGCCKTSQGLNAGLQSSIAFCADLPVGPSIAVRLIDLVVSDLCSIH